MLTSVSVRIELEVPQREPGRVQWVLRYRYHHAIGGFGDQHVHQPADTLGGAVSEEYGLWVRAVTISTLDEFGNATPDTGQALAMGVSTCGTGSAACFCGSRL